MTYRIALAVLVGITAVVSPTPSDARAQTPGCVSPKEARWVSDERFTKVRAHRIFDTRGHLQQADRLMQRRRYPVCGYGMSTTVIYEWDGRNAFRVHWMSPDFE